MVCCTGKVRSEVKDGCSMPRIRENPFVNESLLRSSKACWPVGTGFRPITSQCSHQNIHQLPKERSFCFCLPSAKTM